MTRRRSVRERKRRNKEHRLTRWKVGHSARDPVVFVREYLGISLAQWQADALRALVAEVREWDFAPGVNVRDTRTSQRL